MAWKARPEMTDEQRDTYFTLMGAARRPYVKRDDAVHGRPRKPLRKQVIPFLDEATVAALKAEAAIAGWDRPTFMLAIVEDYILTRWAPAEFPHGRDVLKPSRYHQAVLRMPLEMIAYLRELAGRYEKRTTHDLLRALFADAIRSRWTPAAALERRARVAATGAKK